LKKFFSGLFTFLIVVGIGFLAFTHPAFIRKQLDKVQGVYYVYKGDKELKKAKLQKAINYYTRAVNLYPEHYGAWYNLGNIYVIYEDYYSAVDAYEQAFEHNPKMIIARMNYGIVSAEKLGDFDGAISQYNEILKTKRHLLSIPFVYSNRKSYKVNKGLAYYNRGVAYKQKSVYLDYDYEYRREFLLKALESYKEACKILKKDYDARYNLALTHHLLGNYREAGLTYCKAIEIAPMNYEAHYNLAVLLRHLRYYKESLDELKKASTLISTSNTGISSRQRYIFDVMNDVTRTILANSDNDLVEKISDDEHEHNQITYVNGKMVFTDDLDKAIMKNLKVCGAKQLIKEEIEDQTNEFDDVRYNVHVPGVE
jgi:tetratricopeptide (TPR) repeat protein